MLVTIEMKETRQNVINYKCDKLEEILLIA